MLIQNSNRKDKRFMATFKDGTKVHFGLKNASTYVDGKRTIEERNNYIKRHSVRENFNDPKSAGALSRWLLWGNSTSLDKNHNDFMRKFNIS